jgi:hypothetical protein
MPRKKVLISVTTYPLPSRSYDELVCTAGLLENGEWIRIYPIPLSFLMGQRQSGKMESFKYTWIELELNKRSDDFRPESHSPQNYDFRDIVLYERIGTDGNWLKRKESCLKNVYTNLGQLIKDSEAPKNCSLATFKPKQIVAFEIEDDTREWKDEWVEIRKQGDLFVKEKTPESLIPKLPYKFFYRFKDDAGKESRLMIEDWEIGALYWNCLRAADGVEATALAKVREKYEQEFLKEKDIYLFLVQLKSGTCEEPKIPL